MLGDLSIASPVPKRVRGNAEVFGCFLDSQVIGESFHFQDSQAAMRPNVYKSEHYPTLPIWECMDKHRLPNCGDRQPIQIASDSLRPDLPSPLPVPLISSGSEFAESVLAAESFKANDEMFKLRLASRSVIIECFVMLESSTANGTLPPLVHCSALTRLSCCPNALTAANPAPQCEPVQSDRSLDLLDGSAIA